MDYELKIIGYVGVYVYNQIEPFKTEDLLTEAVDNSILIVTKKLKDVRTTYDVTDVIHQNAVLSLLAVEVYRKDPAYIEFIKIENKKCDDMIKLSKSKKAKATAFASNNDAGNIGIDRITLEDF